MSGVYLQGDWLRLKGQLRKLEMDGIDKRTLHRRIAVYLREATVDRFDTQTGPDGSSWKPLSPTTIELRKKKGGSDEMSILVDNAILKNSITFKALATGAAVGTNIVYGAIQQVGGKAGRGKKVEIPGRPFIGVSDDDTTEIMAIIEEFIEERSV